jgi:hypothetical protein
MEEVMLTCAKEAQELLTDRLNAQIELGVRIVAMTGQSMSLTPHDVKQIVVGFHQMLAEAIAGQENTVFKFFTETVITGIRAQGQSVETIVRTSVIFMTSVVADLVQSAPPQYRDELSSWLARFSADYITAVMLTAHGGPISKSS